MEECEIIEALEETLTNEAVQHPDEFLCTSCTASCVVGIVAHDEMELVVWDGNLRNGQDESRLPVIVKLGRNSSSVASVVEVKFEDFQTITARKATVDADHTSMQIVACTNDTIYRWEFVMESSGVHYELNYDIAADISNNQKKVCVDIFGERSASIDNKTVTVRSEQLNRIRMFNLPTSKENSTLNEISDVVFAGTNHDIVVVCYENGLIMGWHIPTDSIAFKFICNTTSSISNNINSNSSSPVSLLIIDEYSGHEGDILSRDATDGSSASGYINFFIIIGCRDGKVKQFEMLKNQENDSHEYLYSHRECAGLDLRRELRFNSTGSTTKSTDYSSIGADGIDSGFGTSNREIAITPLAMVFVSSDFSVVPSTVACKGGGGGAAAKQPSGRGRNAVNNRKPKAVTVLNSHICVLVPGNVVFINLNTLKLAHTIALSAVGFTGTIQSAAMSVSRLDAAEQQDTSVFDSGGDDDSGGWSGANFAQGQFGEHGDNGHHFTHRNKATGDNSSGLVGRNHACGNVNIVVMTAFDKSATLVAIPLFSNALSGSTTTHSNLSATEGQSLQGVNPPPRRGLSRWKSDNDIPSGGGSGNRGGIACPDSAVADNDNEEDEASRGSQVQGNSSVFENSDIPLSFVLTPSLVAQIDSAREGMSGRSRSLLDVSLKPAATPLAQKGAVGFSTNRNNTSSSSSGGTKGTSTTSARGDWVKPIKDKTGRYMDLPVTFHSKIKSSGYGQKPLDPFAKKRLEQANKLKRSVSAPRQQLLARNDASSNPNTGVNSRRLPLTSGASNRKSGVRVRQYPIDCEPMTQYQPHNEFSAHSPIHSISFNSDASLLGIATTGNVVMAVKLPVAKNGGEAIAYMGHNGRINSVSFSHSKPNGQQMLLSTSVDCTARIWKGGRVDSAAVLFSHTKHQPGDIVPNIGSLSLTQGGMGAVAASLKATAKVSSSSGGKLQNPAAVASGSVSVGGGSSYSRNRPFGCDITSGQFYYMDKFVLLTMKSSVLMYSYDTEAADAKNDLKRLLSTGKYKLVHEWNVKERAQNVCAMACVNSVQSPIILCASSDKTLNVLDAAVGSIIRQIESPHDKNIHCIALPQPSIHVSLSDTEAYNMFATSAIDNVIALCDIRAPRCIARYASHVNKREPVSCCLSPCLRYIATGSEDKTARILDIRTGRELAKLTGHRDVVSSVAFNPLFSQLATASYDGQVKFYVDPLISPNQVGV